MLWFAFIAWVSFDNLDWYLSLWKGFDLSIILHALFRVYLPPRWSLILTNCSFPNDINLMLPLSWERPFFLKTVFLNYLFVLLFLALFGFQWTFAVKNVSILPVGSMWTSPLEHLAQASFFLIVLTFYLYVLWRTGGLKWTRTTDLALIRRAL